MRKSMFAALMAAVSLIPGAAMAQREGDGRSFDRDRPRGAAVEVRETIDQPPPQRTSRQEPQARADRGDDDPRGDRGRGGGRGDDGNRGGGFERRGPDAGRTAPSPVAQVDRGDVRHGPGGRGDGGQWRGGDAGRGNGQWRGGDDRRGNVQWRGNDDRRGNTQWRGNDDRGGDVQWRGNDRGDNQWRGNDRRPDYRGNQGSWNRGWRQDNRYDWNRRRQVNRSAFHLPRYYAPSGWGYGYRRFNIGITLSSGLFSRNYWIDDAYDYGLPDAYGPYRWVRYYNDALLVDVYSGRVVDTVYDIFW